MSIGLSYLTIDNYYHSNIPKQFLLLQFTLYMSMLYYCPGHFVHFFKCSNVKSSYEIKDMHHIYTPIIIVLYVTITNLLELHTSRIFVTCEMYYSLLLLCKMPMEATFLCMS